MIKKSKKALMKAVIILIFLLFFAALAAVIQIKDSSKQASNIVVAITFDTEYPFGVPEYINISEEQWIKTINTINDISKAQNISFQFNVLGKTAEKYPELIKELSISNDVSCHSYSHLHQLNLSYNEKEQEIAKCKEAVEKAINKKVAGNRFPFTKYDNDSIELLSKSNYSWDSSAWAWINENLSHYKIKNLTEFPLFPATTDDIYFISENKTDAKEFYSLLISRINDLKKEDVVYVVILHPWILSIDNERIREFENFVKDLKKENIEISSLDKVYKRLNS